MLAVLPGCGGGGTGSGTDVGSTPDGDGSDPHFTATLSTVRQLTLNWSAPALAQRAVIHEDPDGDGPLPADPRAEVAAADGRVTIEVSLPRALNATYRLAFCTDDRCADVASLQLTGTLEQGMGKIKAVTPLPDSWFGTSLALSADGRVLAVGARYDPFLQADGTTTYGAVHLFERTAAGQWVPRGRVMAPHPDDEDAFGAAVALSADGTVLAIGAPFESALGTAGNGNNDDATYAGAAYVFRRQGDAWTFEAYLKGSAVNAGDFFGIGLDLSGTGDTLVVGAPYSDVPGNPIESDGAAYVFARVGGGWAEQAVLRDGNDANNNYFGSAVAIGGNGAVVAVGSLGNTSAGNGVHANPIADTFSSANTGAVFLYRRTVADAWPLEAFVKAPMNLGEGRFGTALALDASGNTLAVSAPTSSLTVVESGSVHIFQHGPSGWGVAGDPLQEAVPASNRQFGNELALSPDGQTLVVGIYSASVTGTGLSRDGQGTGTADGAGAALVFQRHGDAWTRTAVLRPSDSGDTQAMTNLNLGQAMAIGGEATTRIIGVGTPYHDGLGAGVASDPTGSYIFDPQRTDTGVVYLY